MNPIVFLWCHPRSMSTALERVMRERGDCACFHEPFMYDYYVARGVRRMPHFEVEEDRPTAYADIRASVLEAAEGTAVFVKDMAYYVVPRLFDDEAFADRITHCFLVRDPLKSIPSYFRLDEEMTSEEVGYEAQWRLFEWLRRRRGIAAPVLEAEAVQRDPEGRINALWRRIGFEPCPEAFRWNAETTPQDWQQVSGWHAHAQESRGICKPESESAEERLAAFERLAADAPRLRGFLEHHRPFHERLKEHAL